MPRVFIADSALWGLLSQGPDTFGKVVFLRGFHAGVVPAMDPMPSDVMFDGFAVSYYKIPDYVNVVPDLLGRKPLFSGKSIDVDYDTASFKAISEDLSDRFAARWAGQIKVTKAGAYTFYSKSDDGSRVIVNNVVVVNNDGLHGMGDWKEGTLDMQAGWYPVSIDYFEMDHDNGIKIKYAGPDTSGKVTFLHGKHAKTEEASACASFYSAMYGIVGGWGKIGNKGGGAKVEHCGLCASQCSSIRACLSYECSPTELRCNLNKVRKPTHETYKDYMFCAKDPAFATREMVSGWEAKYFQLEPGAANVPDMRGRVPMWNGTTLAIDFDKEAFKSELSAEDHFAARWTGEVEVLIAGNYTFLVKSDDGARVILDNQLVVDNDGPHSIDEWKEGTIELQVGWHPVTVDYYEGTGGQFVHLKYMGPDTFDRMAFLRAYHAVMNPCTIGFAQMAGDIGGWGQIGDRGGGENVEDCAQCADLCSGEEECGSYECSVTELKCNLNTENLPTNNEGFKDYMFCSRDRKKADRVMLPGWEGKYFKIAEYVSNVPDMRARKTEFQSNTLDINFDKKEFQGISGDFPGDHFAARWTGDMRVTEAGNYTFYVASDDGSRLFVDDKMVIDNDDVHGMGDYVESTVELDAGYHQVTVDYFEQGGDQGIKVKYSGPDTASKRVSLRVYHEPPNPCASDYKRVTGDVRGWGIIGGKGGGEAVQDCGECAGMCSSAEECGSYECSPTELRCNLNKANKPSSSADYRDFMFCVKDDTSASNVMLPGFEGSFFKTGDYVTSVPDMKGRNPGFNFTSLDVDFDQADFKTINESFPRDHFAARWIGEIKIDVGGNYSFLASSDDGCRVIVNNVLVVDHDGLHPMEEKRGEPIELRPGWYPVTVREQVICSSSYRSLPVLPCDIKAHRCAQCVA